MKTILIQLDTDPQASTFHRVVAIDAGVDELCSCSAVTPDNVEPLVHGAMFTRGGENLRHTAIFVGGSDVAAGEKLFERVQKTFFGPMRVSVMIDSNGSNTTAAAAVLSARRHLNLAGAEALVLGGTGPVGQRVAQLLAMEQASVRVGSRSMERARRVCDGIAARIPGARLTAMETGDQEGWESSCRDVALVVSAGAAGVQLMSAAQCRSIESLQVAIDLNAVPPVGIEGINVTDQATEQGGVVCYGAIGVGGLKMKIHKAAVQRLFQRNDQILDTEAIYRIGEELNQ